ncbi:Ohr family peroxiredoxin [Bradyrhizobium sp. DASA03120]|uniref:Ohr family peroxiredoxin n=1 Tax=Bradyrhizobium sp. SMVTL-02 TaxID=3395917 RepID=UPI003F6F9D4A
MATKGEPGEVRVIYTARTRTTGGRDHGFARSHDGNLDVKLAKPGSIRMGTNPEQLFGAGWSACFSSAIVQAARLSKVSVGDVAIEAEINLHLADSTDYFLSARFNISISGVSRVVAQDLIRQAELLCPYSKATRGNIEITVNLTTI